MLCHKQIALTLPTVFFAEYLSSYNTKGRSTSFSHIKCSLPVIVSNVMAAEYNVQGHGRTLYTLPHLAHQGILPFLWHSFCFERPLSVALKAPFGNNSMLYSRITTYLNYKACQNTVEPYQLRRMHKQPLWLCTHWTLLFGISSKTVLVWTTNWNKYCAIMCSNVWWKLDSVVDPASLGIQKLLRHCQVAFLFHLLHNFPWYFNLFKMFVHGPLYGIFKKYL